MLPEAFVEFSDPAVAETLTEVLVELTAQRIGEVTAVVGERRERGDCPIQHQIANEHLVVRVLFRAPALGEPFGPPQRDWYHAVARVPVEHAGELGELEEVDELVAYRVAKILVAAVERQGDTALQVLGEASDALGQEAREYVRLLEVLV